MKIIFMPIVFAFVILVVTSSIAFAQTNGLDTSHLLESGKADKITESKPGDELKLVSYNIRWRSGEELQQIIRWLKDSSGSRPFIVGLQEVDRDRKRSGRTNHVKAIAGALGMYYAWTAPHINKSKTHEEETGVAILSPFPLTDVTRIVLPHEGPGGRLRVALGATTEIGKTRVRVYSVHSEVRMTMGKKFDQLRAVLDDLAKHPKEIAAIVVGDFNSWEMPVVNGTRKLFTDAGFTTPFPDDESTFEDKFLMFNVKLKLDWIWVRGLTPTSYGIERSLKVSDHYPLWTVVNLPNATKTGPDIPETR